FVPLHAVPDCGKKHRYLLPGSTQGLPRASYLFSEMAGNIAVGKGSHGNCGLIYGLDAHSAKTGPATCRRTTVRTDRFEPRATVLAKDRIKQILALTLPTKHNGNQSQMGCIALILLNQS